MVGFPFGLSLLEAASLVILLCLNATARTEWNVTAFYSFVLEERKKIDLQTVFQK